MGTPAVRALAPHEEDAAPLPAGIHRLALPTPFPIGRVNCYLLEGEPLTLVDTGVNTGTTLVALEEALAALGYRVEDLGLIIISHAHIDHMGLAPILARRAGCPTAGWHEIAPLHDPAANPSRMFHAGTAWATQQLILGGYPKELALASRSVLELGQALGSLPEITHPLHEGDVLRAGDHDWVVHHRPGHSLSDLVLLRADGVALSADHLLRSISPNPTLSPPMHVLLPDAETPRVPSLQRYLASLEQTAQDPITLMLTGHGSLIGDPGELIAERQEFHARRAERLLRELSDEPITPYALACGLWRTMPMLQTHLTYSEVRGHLDLLLADGRAVEERLPGGGEAFRAA